MRILILADVHANWEALFSLQRAEPRPDAVLFAGDAAGYGPDPAECVRWLLAQAHLAVLGNHDALLDPMRDRRAVGCPVELELAAGEALALARRRLAPADVARLSAWPEVATAALGGAGFLLCHGTPQDPLGGQINAATAPEAELERLFADAAADVVVLGHSHLPALRRLGKCLIVNPGSLGQPRYGVPDATYAVWDDGQIQIKHLHYDHQAVVRRLRLTPLSAEAVEQLAAVLSTGLLPDSAPPPS